jgi:hypothetical protein
MTESSSFKLPKQGGTAPERGQYNGLQQGRLASNRCVNPAA